MSGVGCFLLLLKATEQNASSESDNELDIDFAEVDDGIEEAQNTDDLSGVKVPYEKLREQADKASDLEKQLAAYKQRFGDLNQSPPPSNFDYQPHNPEFNQPSIPPQQPQQAPHLTAEQAKLIDDAIREGAMQISGLSQEDIDSIDYMEDTDPRKSRWRYANKLAENAVFNNIIASQIAQQQALQRADYLKSQATSDFDSYTNQQIADKNFNDIQSFATGEFFNAQSDLEKQILADAYGRLKYNQASPTDMALIKGFFTRARAVYETKNKPQPVKKSPAAKKPQFPRTNQTSGVTGSGGGISASSLEHMLHTKSWNEIPPEYQKMLLGI